MKPEKGWTTPEVLQMFTNLGCDVRCGACMEVAFTGATTNLHNCTGTWTSSGALRDLADSVYNYLLSINPESFELLRESEQRARTLLRKLGR